MPGLPAAPRRSGDGRDRAPAGRGDPVGLAGARARGRALGRAVLRADRGAVALGTLPRRAVRADDLRASRRRRARRAGRAGGTARVWRTDRMATIVIPGT